MGERRERCGEGESRRKRRGRERVFGMPGCYQPDSEHSYTKYTQLGKRYLEVFGVFSGRNPNGI